MPTTQTSTERSQLDSSVDLRAQLAIVHELKERMLLRRREESGAALRILPNDGEFSGKSGARGSGLEGSVILQLVRIGKCDQESGTPNVQMCDRNRTI